MIFASLAARWGRKPEIYKETSNFPGDRRYEDVPDPTPAPRRTQPPPATASRPPTSTPPPATPVPTPTPTPTPKKRAEKYRFSHLVVDQHHQDFQKNTKGCLDRAHYNLSLLTPFGLDVNTHKNTDEYVLVLGSGGFIGSALKTRLEAAGYKCLHVLSRHHHDLRLEHALEIFSPLNIKFVYFMAYEVGGAKFRQSPENQRAIHDNNIRITNNVFNWIKKKQVRFCFASSSLVDDNSTYGIVKRIGEEKAFEMADLGRVVRLWNVYGFEYPGPKSHAIPDFVFQCLMDRHLQLLTNGEEKRQFMHIDDVSNALIAVMEHFEETPRDVDISDGTWTSMADIAREVVKQLPDCVLNLSSEVAVSRTFREANLTSDWHKKWLQPKINISEGIADVVTKMNNYINEAMAKPAVAFVIDCGKNLTDEVLANVSYVVDQIYTMAKMLKPMKVQIVAAANHLLTENRTFPCDVLICTGHHRRKAVKYVQASAVVVMNYMTVPTFSHMAFFQRQLVQDFMFYYAGRQRVNTSSEAHGETNATVAHFTMVNDCNVTGKMPKDLSFIVASQETWKSIKVPPDDVAVHDWLMRFVPGYVAVKFESPVWTWAGKRRKVPHQNEVCCTGVVRTAEIKSGLPTIYAGLPNK